jgi:hypothetical protein
MQLPKPVTFTPASFIDTNGKQHTFPPMTLTDLSFVLIDDSARKSARTILRFGRRPLILWEGAEYDAAGDYTQAQVEARVLERLGSNFATALEELSAPLSQPVLVPPLKPKPQA